MTTTDHTSGVQLTRRQLREQQMTGQTPVITPEAVDEAAAEAAARVEQTRAPLPRAVDTIVPAAPPVPRIDPNAEHAEHADGHPLTRREARELERIRTASVPVIAPEGAAEPQASEEEVIATVVEPEATQATEAEAPVVEAVIEAEATQTPEAAPEELAEAAASLPVFEPAVEETVAEKPAIEEPVAAVLAVDEVADEAPVDAPETDEQEANAPVRRLDEGFGSGLTEQPPLFTTPGASFDSVIGRDTDTSGSSSSGHALIVTDSVLPPLTAPVTSNGETLVTGTFALPESLSAQGHAGRADGKDVDAVLIDGELPPTSSPTPIAATAAVSQAKTPGEIIKPPVPEKNNKLILALGVMAGALAISLCVFVIITLSQS